jgi:MFS family permease
VTTAAPTPLERVSIIPWRIAVFALFVCNGLAVGTWASRTPAIKAALDLDLAQMGLLITAIPGGALLGLLASSHVLELLGERRTMLVGQLASLLGVGGFGVIAVLTGNALLGAPFLALYGLGIATTNIVINLEAAASDRVTGRTLMPIFHAAFSVGLMVGAGLGAVAAGVDLPIDIHFPLLAALVIAVTLGVVRFIPELREPHVEAPSFAERMKVWGERRTLLVGLIVLAASFTEGTANNWLNLAMVQGRDWQPAVGAASVTVFAASMVAGRALGGYAVDRIGRVAALRTVFALAFAGVLVVTFIDNEVATFAGVALWGLGASLGYPLGVSAAADDPRNAAARVAVVATVATVSGLLGPTVIGLLGKYAGLPHAFIVVAVLAALALLVAGAARPTRP